MFSDHTCLNKRRDGDKTRMAIFQRPFGRVIDGDNPNSITDSNHQIHWGPPERRLACVFLLDTSGSMAENDAIGKLNEGLSAFKECHLDNPTEDELIKACIDVALVSFGPDVKVQQEFTAMHEMVLPTLTAYGGTPLGAAIDKALDMIAAYKAKYIELGVPLFRPWVFCITDGGPNDSYAAAAQRLKEMEDATKVLGYCVGVANFDRHTMASIFNTERIFELENLNFPALFKFAFNSFVTVRNSVYDGCNVVVEAPGDLHKMAKTDGFEW